MADATWLSDWLSSLQLELDVPLPDGVDRAGGVSALLDYAWDCGTHSREQLVVSKAKGGITVRSGYLPGLPVFTVEWEQPVDSLGKGATASTFLDVMVHKMAERASEWDTTFLGADYLADHGSPDTLDRFARLVRWRFRAAPMRDREMLYVVVPYRGPSASPAEGPQMICYISVKGPRFPVAAGFSRAKNLVPSFDLCEAAGDGALRVRHCMTTDIGGSVPWWVWNHLMKPAVLAQNVTEAAHVRDTLRAICRDSERAAEAPAAEEPAAGAGRKPRVLIVGFGDSGLTTALHLASSGVTIVGISAHPCHYSAQELGGRLAQPALWRQVYLLPFTSYRMLDGVRIVHGLATAVDPEQRTVTVQLPSGETRGEGYDALLISTGATNGFWRKRPTLESLQAARAAVGGGGEGAIAATLRMEQERLAAASVIAVIGGGPSAVSASYNLARRFHPSKEVHCFWSGEQVLPGYHPRVRARIQAKMREAGVALHPHHRAVVPEGFARDALGDGPISWSSGQREFACDLVLWATGAGTPNTGFLPPEMLDADGYVAVDDCLQVRGHEGRVFAVGDVAATDPGRTSARNDGWALVGANMLAALRGTPEKMGRYKPPAYRWGSILGPWDGLGYEVYFQNGLLLWLPLSAWNVFWPLVQRFLFAGMRNEVHWGDRAVG